MDISSLKIQIATENDVPDLEYLVETCYRGELSKSGWTTEADMFEGPRVTTKMLKNDMENPNVTIFKCIVDDNDFDNILIEKARKLIGCVRTERHGDSLHMGMICVHPSIQNLGLGRKLLGKVEEFAKESNYKSVDIMVILQRTELLAWYERKGYKRTGETVPVPVWDGEESSGQKVPVDVLVLKKNVI